MTEKKEDVNSVITLRSPKLGSAPDTMYITDNHLLFGNHKVEIDNVESLDVTDSGRIGLRAAGIILVNTITGTILAYTLPVGIFIASLIVLSSAILGFGIVQIIREEPVAMVSLKTTEREYKFGVDNQLDMATLFASVKGEIDEQITREKIMSSDSPQVVDKELET